VSDTLKEIFFSPHALDKSIDLGLKDVLNGPRSSKNIVESASQIALSKRTNHSIVFVDFNDTYASDADLEQSRAFRTDI